MDADLERERLRLAAALARDRHGLTRFARTRAPQDADAEDVVSEVVLRLFERADLLAHVENLTAYLFHAVGNALTDLFRRRRDHDEVSEDSPDPAAGPEAALEQAQLRARLDAALDRLSPPERAVWVAVEVEGWTYRELAEHWNQPLGTLLSRKNRATRTLKRLLAADGPEQGTPTP